MAAVRPVGGLLAWYDAGLLGGNRTGAAYGTGFSGCPQVEGALCEDALPPQCICVFLGGPEVRSRPSPLTPPQRATEAATKQQLLQLAAHKQGADIGLRRRLPHAATPESILARSIAALPKWQVGGVLAFGLHAAGSSALTAITPSASQQPVMGFAEAQAAPTSSHTLAAASGAAAAPASGTEA